jgi:hypothetical protein
MGRHVKKPRIKRERKLLARGDVTPCALCGFPLYGLDTAWVKSHVACRTKARLEMFAKALRQPPKERPPVERRPRSETRHGKKLFPEREPAE